MAQQMNILRKHQHIRTKYQGNQTSQNQNQN